ncbi:MAG: class II fructose-bisphosphate aldolase, partial [Paracoccaceae bacterium]|nr:class II fructose-bisphosphate aldolase [Paracoccaceae bacterium]
IEEIELGIKNGVRKVNIDTDLRMALTGAIRKVFSENPGEFDPRKYLAPGVDAMSEVCKDRFERFGSAGMAGKIIPIALAQMAARY